jgi:RNA polymerase sigma-70 factor (ECF subfamily)
MEAPAPNVLPTFETLMQLHLDAAYNLARWLLRNDHDAQDAVQEACVRAWRAFDRYRGGDSRAWLLTIVRNVCYSHLRQIRREPEVEEFSDESHGTGDVLAETKAVEWLEAKSEALHQALERLPAEFREVIVLHEIEGLPYREIAVVADIPLGTVMSRLARARKKLQMELCEPTPKESAHGL